MHSTHEAVYLAPENMHTNNLLVHSGCHYCKQMHAGIEASSTPFALVEYLCYLHLSLSPG